LFSCQRGRRSFLAAGQPRDSVGSSRDLGGQYDILAVATFQELGNSLVSESLGFSFRGNRVHFRSIDHIDAKVIDSSVELFHAICERILFTKRHGPHAHP